MKTAITLFVIMSLVACGKSKQTSRETPGTKTETPTSPAAMYFQTKNEMGACDESKKNVLAYVLSEQAFYGCDGTAWSVIDVQGPAGPAGPTGATGAQGQDGGDHPGLQKILSQNGTTVDLCEDSAQETCTLQTSSYFNFDDYFIFTAYFRRAYNNAGEEKIDTMPIAFSYITTGVSNVSLGNIDRNSVGPQKAWLFFVHEGSDFTLLFAHDTNANGMFDNGTDEALEVPMTQVYQAP